MISLEESKPQTLLKDIFFKSNLINVLKEFSYALYDPSGNQIYYNLNKQKSNHKRYKLRYSDSTIGILESNEYDQHIVKESILFKVKQSILENEFDNQIQDLNIQIHDYYNYNNISNESFDNANMVKVFCQKILSSLSNIICCEYSSIYLLDKNNALVEVALLDYVQIQIPSFKSFIENCACLSINSAKSFELNNSLESLKNHEDIKLQLTHLEGQAGIYPDDLYITPLKNQDQVVGAICFANKSIKGFSENEISRIEYYSSIIADSIFVKSKKQQIIQEELTHKSLNKYLDQNVTSKFDKKKFEKIGGIEKNIVPLFGIIHNFSKITSVVSHKLLVPLLNHYYETMNKVIKKHHGTLDKIIGNTFLVVWNHPNLVKDPEIKAIQCAIDMQKIVNKYIRPLWKSKGIPGLSIGIGINTGPAIAGNLGSEEFLDYTVIGDTINTAQRLESVAKPNEIIVHENVMRLAIKSVEKPHYRYTNLKLKGKATNTVAYAYKIAG